MDDIGANPGEPIHQRAQSKPVNGAKFGSRFAGEGRGKPDRRLGKVVVSEAFEAKVFLQAGKVLVVSLKPRLGG